MNLQPAYMRGSEVVVVRNAGLESDLDQILALPLIGSVNLGQVA